MAIKRVLVVDDDSGIREVLASLLSRLGHVAVMARDGAEALAKFDENQFHLVLTDFSMPGMSGDELAQEIKRRYQSVPVVLITGSRMADLSENFDGVLRKPFSTAELEAAIAFATLA
jgi:CheY-like chemotaxis protein